MDSETATKINELAKSLQEKRLAMNMEEAVKMARKIVLGEESAPKKEEKTVNELFAEQSALKEMKKEVDSLKGEREDMEVKQEERIEGIKDDLKEIKKTGDEMADDMKHLKEDVEEIKKDVEEEKREVKALKENVDDVEEMKEELKRKEEE